MYGPHCGRAGSANLKSGTHRNPVTIEASADLAPEQPLVVGLASEIHEALVNLIFNAVDAMPDGGHLTLRTYSGPGPEDGHGRAYVEVVDDGVGMDQKLRLECLDPFVTTKGEWGTGLGLAMVYGVVQRHDGSLDIQSEPAKGTRVRLGFPRAFADGRRRLGTRGSCCGSHGHPPIRWRVRRRCAAGSS